MLSGAPGRSYLGDTVRLEYAENPGGFLSLGANLAPVTRTAFFTVITGLMLLALIIFAVRRTLVDVAMLGAGIFVLSEFRNERESLGGQGEGDDQETLPYGRCDLLHWVCRVHEPRSRHRHITPPEDRITVRRPSLPHEGWGHTNKRHRHPRFT